MPIESLLFGAIVAAIASLGCRHEADRAAAPAKQIPRSTGSIAIDGEWNEPDWSRVALRGQFTGDDGALARPSSEVRLLHDDNALIVGLYAADENIQTSDAFVLTVDRATWRIDATGRIDPAAADVRVGVDRDGSLDDPRNNDEEWVLEVAIPLAALGTKAGQPLDVTASRCDVTKDGVRRCGSWSAALMLAL